jgi:ABC-type transporter Mla maintaining outer membrane lipid asymmetry ATPase subunit MlaF
LALRGGERRRLAIASETLCLRAGSAAGSGAGGDNAPGGSGGGGGGSGGGGGGGGGIILADEPTTGLDAHQADKIVEMLSATAREEAAAVMCVLHQPRSAIFQRLDDLLLLASGGRVAYCGTAAAALEHFESLAGTDKCCSPRHPPHCIPSFIWS